MTSKELASVLKAYRSKPAEFNSKLLRRPPYWSKQVEICKSFLDYRVSACTTGNGIGKSYVASGLLLWALMCFPGSKILSTAPSNQLLSDVLWGEVRQAWAKSVFADLLPDVKVKSNPQRLVLCDGWDAVGWSSDSTAKMSGRHRGDLIWLIDEGSDILPEVWEGIWSTNPSKVLVLGNPLTTGTDFHKLCTSPSSQTNVIQVSCLDTPDIHLPRSKRGMADATWLQGIREQYGEDSPYWKVHVLGQFCDQDEHTLIPLEWLARCSTPRDFQKEPVGDVWVACDLGAGNGGDESVIVVADNRGVLEWDASNRWDYPAGVASRVAALTSKYHVQHSRVIYDQGGLGVGFNFALQSHGIQGARGYVGGAAGGKFATNFRSAAALAFKDRLDPSRNPTPLYIPDDLMRRLRPEVKELRYELASQDKIALENKEGMKKRLGKSPDILDAFLVLYGFMR